jgi:hypothetical protein
MAFFVRPKRTEKHQQKASLLFVCILASLWAPALAAAQAWPSHQDRYNFFMELLEGKDGSSLPLWSQHEPVPFHVVSLYPVGTKLGLARINITQSVEHAMDFGRTGCGLGIPSIFRKETDPKKARFFLFVAPDFQLVSKSPLFAEQARWFSRNGYFDGGQLNDILASAENAKEVVVTIPALPKNEPIARLITIVIPEYSEKPGAAVYEGVVRSFLPGRYSDAVIPSFFNTRGKRQDSNSAASRISSDTIYPNDIEFLSYLYRQFSERYLDYIGGSRNPAKTSELFDAVARHLTIATYKRRKNCKLVY